MRPPSYYMSLANSSSSGGSFNSSPTSSNNPRSSSQQLRSSLSSISSTSYATRTHLPFAPHTMLVAHCYTGVGSSTKPYGQSSSSAYSSQAANSRLGTASAVGSYTPSYSARPFSTKRHSQYTSPISSSSSSPSVSKTSSYTPRHSHYLSSSASSSTTSSYRPSARPSAYTYQPIRLRERPLLARISNQLSNSSSSGTRYATSSRPPSGSAARAEESSKRIGDDSQEEEASKSITKEEQLQQEQVDWSSDVARNISRNKYLIKFREFDKRASIAPESNCVLSLDQTEASKHFEKRDGPNICVTVKLPEEVAPQLEDNQMRLPPVSERTSSESTVAYERQESLALASQKDDCDEPLKKVKDGETKKTKVPKERRNIKLKIKNVNPVKVDQISAAAAATTNEAVDQAVSIVGKLNRKKPSTVGDSQESFNDPTERPPKTKVKRVVKNSKLAIDSSVPTDNSSKATQNKEEEPKREIRAKDSLLTKKLSGRKVLGSKQLNLKSSSEATNEALGSKPETKTTTTDKKSDHPSDSPNTQAVNKRIKFREYSHDDFNFLSVLGHGGWGFVILAELKNHDACFAVKCIKKITIVEDDDFDSIMIERKVLTLGNIHPFICKLFCTFETEGYLFFAMEYCAGGDLMFHVQREGKFTEARSRFYAAEIICAIKFLHNQHIIYRDLKLDNILLDSRGHIRLVDFGMCQCRTYREEMLPSNFCGTPEYISPEIIKGVPYNHSVDWWSFGVLLYEMAVGKMPFRGNDENELLWNVCYEQIHYPMFLTKELTSLLQSLLEREPTKRMGMSTCKAGDIYDQAWFKGVDWRAIEELRVPPPFVPDVTSERDVQNFDSDFTQSTPELSPVDESTLKKIDQSQFKKFPYTNPNISIFG